MTLREQAELTRANHGDAYRLILWPESKPVELQARLEFIRANWEALYNLCVEADKHHKGGDASTLYKVAIYTLFGWLHDYYS
jgi:hypothetical protein